RPYTCSALPAASPTPRHPTRPPPPTSPPLPYPPLFRSEANNLAVIGLSLANPRGRHLVTTAIEHPSVLRSCEFLERVYGFEITTDRKSTRLNSSHVSISYAVFCLQKKKTHHVI